LLKIFSAAKFAFVYEAVPLHAILCDFYAQAFLFLLASTVNAFGANSPMIAQRCEFQFYALLKQNLID